MKTNLLKLTLPAVALMLAASANAVPTLTITDGAGNTASGIISGPGTLTFNGAVGDWNINILSALTFPALGSATTPNIDVGGQDNYKAGSFNGTTIPGGNVLTIVFTADGFGPVSGPLAATIGGTQNGGTLTFVTKANGAMLTASGVVGTGPYSNTKSGVLNNFNGSLQEIITLTANSSTDFVSLDANLEVVPDSGMTLVLLGSSLTVLALFARTRKVVA
jgi:hypothetical protein